MKRWIMSSTQTDIKNELESRFQNEGRCSHAEVTKMRENHCEMNLILPNGNPTTITVWYEYTNENKGTRKVTSRSKWKPGYTVDDDGTVKDEQGNIIGQAYVIKHVKDAPKISRNYSIDSIRTDSGDVIIDHPSKANNYALVVQTLENRKITHRS